VTGPDHAPTGAVDLSATVAAVGAAIERLTFNVALARLMEAVRRVGEPVSKRVFVRLLAPFAPHLTEELWHQLGEPYSVHTQRWPSMR
jgi:leucyl-tRNA synthetase